MRVGGVERERNEPAAVVYAGDTVGVGCEHRLAGSMGGNGGRWMRIPYSIKGHLCWGWWGCEG
jgi:hypothetical protein